MISLGYHILLHDKNSADQYKEYHKKVWPNVEQALTKIGIQKMRIFFVEPLKLFMYIEAVDNFNPESDFQAAEDSDPKVKEWCEIMNKQLLKRQNPDEGIVVWQLMEDVYHFELSK